MGFAPVAAVAILMIAGLFSLSAYTVQRDAADDGLIHAERDALRRADDVQRTSFSITGTNYQNGPNRLTIDLSNDGSTTIQTDDIDVIIDGVVRNADINYIRVEGSAVAYWPALQTAEIRIDSVTSQPARVAVIAHNGVAAYAEV